MKNTIFDNIRIGAINLFPDDREDELSIPSHTDDEAFQEDLKQVGSDMYSAMQTIAITEQPKKLFNQQ